MCTVAKAAIQQRCDRRGRCTSSMAAWRATRSETASCSNLTAISSSWTASARCCASSLTCAATELGSPLLCGRSCCSHAAGKNRSPRPRYAGLVIAASSRRMHQHTSCRQGAVRRAARTWRCWERMEEVRCSVASARSTLFCACACQCALPASASCSAAAWCSCTCRHPFLFQSDPLVAARTTTRRQTV